MSSHQRFPRHPENEVIEMTIPPKDIKRLDDPYNENGYAYECLVPVTQAAKLVIGAANPRKQNLEKPLSRKILNTLVQEPKIFHLWNRGIWVAAQRAEYDNQSQTLLLHCPQNIEERYGVIDGGHTKAIIEEFLELAKEQGKPIKPVPYVMLHVRVGVEENLEDMVVSLNRSTQLKEYTLDEYKGEFDKLKAILAKEPFADDIGYVENERTEYDILDVIQRLTLLCAPIYPNAGDSHPTVAYSSKAKCLQQFVREKAKYLAMKPIIGDCFRLADQIEVLLPEVSGSERFGRFNFARKQKPRIPASLKATPTNRVVDKWTSCYAVSEAVIYPLVASLRVLVRSKADGTVIGWRQDPVRFFRKHGDELFAVVRRYYEEEGKSLTALGKKSEFWARLHHVAYVSLHPED